MRLRATIMLPLAAVLGLSSVQAGRMWLDRQVEDRIRGLQAQALPAPQVAFGTLVVAAAPLRYGAEINTGNVKEIPWPQQDLPRGAFTRVSDLVNANMKRVALSQIEDNEPILATKVTGPGQRANLAAVIGEDMKAISVRVDDVIGVAGFVLPGDRVDVLLRRQARKDYAFADNILQNVKVLAIDQTVDEKSGKTGVARVVTLEVSIEMAQRLVVAEGVGTLTLVLRSLGQAQIDPPVRTTSDQLVKSAAAPRDVAPSVVPAPSASTVTIGVIRNAARVEYSVPSTEMP